MSTLFFSLRSVWLRARLAFAQSRPGRAGLRGTRYLVTPPQLLAGDGSIASDLYAGQFVFAGRSLLTGGRLIFDCQPPSDGFARNLHGFAWLNHFEQTESAILHAHARMLFRVWMERYDRAQDAIAREPEVRAERLIAVITHAGLLLEEADYDFYHRTLDMLARDAAVLRLLARSKRIGMTRLHAALAYLMYAICLDIPKSLIEQAEKLFEKAVKGTIHKDGTPKDRSGLTAADIARHLVPLQAAYRARQRQVPSVVSQTLRSLCAFLRLIQHPDGAVAQFHGAGQVPRDLASLLSNYGHWQTGREESAPDGGFERLENQHAVLIADAGAITPPDFSDKIGASGLAFEFSTRTDRLIVSCGLPEARNEAIEAAYRSESAHSSIMLDDVSLARLRPTRTLMETVQFRLAHHAAPLTTVHDDAKTGERIILGHSGYQESLGYLIERHLILREADGGLSGLDRIVPAQEQGDPCRVTLRFHLHPKVVPQALVQQDAVLLRLPHQPEGHDLWLFEAKGQTLDLDESRCFEHGLLQVRAQQIVLDVAIAGATDIAWQLSPYHHG